MGLCRCISGVFFLFALICCIVKIALTVVWFRVYALEFAVYVQLSTRSRAVQVAMDCLQEAFCIFPLRTTIC